MESNYAIAWYDEDHWNHVGGGFLVRTLDGKWRKAVCVTNQKSQAAMISGKLSLELKEAGFLRVDENDVADDDRFMWCTADVPLCLGLVDMGVHESSGDAIGNGHENFLLVGRSGSVTRKTNDWEDSEVVGELKDYVNA